MMAALPPPAEAGGFLRRHFYETEPTKNRLL